MITLTRAVASSASRLEPLSDSKWDVEIVPALAEDHVLGYFHFTTDLIEDGS